MTDPKRRARGGQLLLLAALLFGIVTMHTLGHPSGHGGGTEQATGRHEMSAGKGSAHAHKPTAATSAPASASVSASVSASDPTGMAAGMDPLSVCLAVLGAFTLVLLLKAGLSRPGGLAAPARPLARLLDGLRPNPPPPRILLSHLSVLRI